MRGRLVQKKAAVGSVRETDHRESPPIPLTLRFRISLRMRRELVSNSQLLRLCGGRLSASILSRGLGISPAVAVISSQHLLIPVCWDGLIQADRVAAKKPEQEQSNRHETANRIMARHFVISLMGMSFVAEISSASVDRSSRILHNRKITRMPSTTHRWSGGQRLPVVNIREAP